MDLIARATMLACKECVCECMSASVCLTLRQLVEVSISVHVLALFPQMDLGKGSEGPQASNM